MKKPKNENRFQHKGVKYKAVNVENLEICGDCVFFQKGEDLPDKASKPSCLIPKKIDCVSHKRKDNRNIKWRIVGEN